MGWELLQVWQKKGKSREEGLVLGRTFFNIPGTGGNELVVRES